MVLYNKAFVLFINELQQLIIVTFKQNKSVIFKKYFYFNGIYNGPEIKITDYNTGLKLINSYNNSYNTPSPATLINQRLLRNQLLSVQEIQQNQKCNFNNVKYTYNFYNTLNYNYAFITTNIPKNNKLFVLQYIFNNGVWNLQKTFNIPLNTPLQTYLFGCPNNNNYTGEFYPNIPNTSYDKYNISPQVNVIGRLKSNNLL